MFLRAILLSFLCLTKAQVLVDFQVAQPPPVPLEARQCTVEILQHDFAFSFGAPAIVQYTPPTDCGPIGSWAAVTLNFTVTSNGTQFDRLGIFTFQNVEIWRTSTPEPTFNGIIWTYVKDVSRYIPLFAEPGTFILQLDNLIQTGLNGIYSTTLHATFFESSPTIPPAPKSDLIIPLSTLLNNTGDDASVPPGFSINVTLPQNTVKVFAELYASGNGNEEFWYFNTANEFLSDLPPGASLGQGPFREVRLLVDGQVAGVAFPYATIFTGGIVPTAWRPITSYGALDLPTYFLDLTPFVPLLVDGNAHNFTIDVASAEADHSINQNWFVSGLLQVVTDPSSKPTTGRITKYVADPFAVSSTTGSVGTNGDVNVTVTATRNIQIEAEITSGSGETNNVVWSQSLQYSNTQNFLNNITIQNVFQTATGQILSSHNGVDAVADSFSYPLNINITLLDPDGSSFDAFFDHSYIRDLLASPLIPRMDFNNHQLASGFFLISSTGNSGNGTNSNVFSYSDTQGNTFQQEVNAVLNNITLDRESGSLARSQKVLQSPFAPGASTFHGFGAARLPGGRIIGL